MELVYNGQRLKHIQNVMQQVQVCCSLSEMQKLLQIMKQIHLVTLASTQANNANTTLLNVQDFIVDQSGTSDINAASAISRENRFLNLEVGYNEVDGGFTFKSAQNDQVSILVCSEATENELFGLGLQPTSVNEETDLYGSGFYPNGDEIRTQSEQRYGIKVEFDDTTKHSIFPQVRLVMIQL